MLLAILRRKDAALVLLELLDGPKKMTSLKTVVANYDTLRNLVRDLQDMKLLKMKETFEDRRVIYVTLTETGKSMAVKLKMLSSDDFIPIHQQREIEAIMVRTHKWKSIEEFVKDATAERIRSLSKSDVKTQ